jgi:Fe-S cluster assembly ATP-binding protein
MSGGLVISGLRARVGSKEILKGIDLTVPAGEVHAVMGPNGSGKSTLSHVITGKPGYDCTGGSVTLDGVELLGLPTWRRAQAGLYLAMQYPVEVPGMMVEDTLAAALKAAGRPYDAEETSARLADEAVRVGLEERLLSRAMNVELSGGERKRNEIIQMAVLKPKVAVLDEVDSGLDVDALRSVAKRVREAVAEWGLGVLAITHYTRLLEELHPDRVHVLAGGRIVDHGGPELANELENSGYAAYGGDQPGS